MQYIPTADYPPTTPPPQLPLVELPQNTKLTENFK